MKRAVQARACAAGVTALSALTLGLGAVVTQSGTAYAAGTQDVQIPAPDAVVPRGVSIVAAGVDGVVEQEDGTTGYQFISTANREVRRLPGLDGALQKLAQSSYGPWLLWLTAAGLIAYGIFCLVDARLRDVSTG